MKIKKCFSIVTILLIFVCYDIHGTEKFYSASFLKDYKTVRTYLKNFGFTKVTFKTSDNLSLKGLFLSRPNATCNLVICAGWLPGRKEGMATFYSLLPEYCNILLFDSRGHGESEGSLLWPLWRYGIDEYKDVIAATEYLSAHNRLPIIIAGICSGAFNAAHAIIHLEKKNAREFHHIKGLIFDSGWGSVVKIVTTAPSAGIKKRITLFLDCLFYGKKVAQQSLLYRYSCSIADHVCTLAYHLGVKFIVSRYDKTTNLTDKIDRIQCPILFIHSYDDVYAEMNEALALSSRACNKECWWIEKSSHAKHHLIHKDLYRQKITAFIDIVLEKSMKVI